jgi:hypothetical protein
MKKICSLLLLLIVGGAASAQSYTGLVDYQKMSRQAVFSDVPFPEKEVAAAIQDSMEKLGYKAKDSKGFTVFRGVRLPVFGNEVLDLYFSVDRKSRKEKEVAVITMMLSRGSDNFITQGADPGVIENAKEFLNGLAGSLGAYDLEKQISEQEEQTRSAEKKANNLADEGQDLQKKRKKIDKEIEENAKDQADQNIELEKQRQNLETLKAKRKQ